MHALPVTRVMLRAACRQAPLSIASPLPRHLQPVLALETTTPTSRTESNLRCWCRQDDANSVGVSDWNFHSHMFNFAARLETYPQSDHAALAFAAMAQLVADHGRWSSATLLPCQFSSSGGGRPKQHSRAAGRAAPHADDIMLACLTPRLAKAMLHSDFGGRLVSQSAAEAAPVLASAALRACADSSREAAAASQLVLAALAHVVPAAAAALPGTPARRGLVCAIALTRLLTDVLPASAQRQENQQLWAALAQLPTILAALLRLAERCGNVLGDAIKAQPAGG